MKVVFIVGLPGSGKSHLARSMAENPDFVVFDDMGVGDTLKRFVNHFDHSKDTTAVLVDPMCCDPVVRKEAEEFLTALRVRNVGWIFFENDPVACQANIKRRTQNGDDRKVDDFISYMSKRYTIPEGSVTVPVWKPGKEV